MIFTGDLIEKSRGQSPLIPEFHAHVGQIPSDDIAHGFAVRSRDLAYSVDEIRDMDHSAGLIWRATHSWKEPTRIGTTRNFRAGPRIYCRKRTWNSIECSERCANSSDRRSVG